MRSEPGILALGEMVCLLIALVEMVPSHDASPFLKATGSGEIVDVAYSS